MHKPESNAMTPLDRHNEVTKSPRSLPHLARILRKAPYRFRFRIIKTMDRAYVALQVVFRTLGFLPPYDDIPEVEIDGDRFASWEPREHPPRLPAFRVPLPPDVVLTMTFNSIFSRGGVWRSTGTPGEMRDFLRDQLGEEWKPVPGHGPASVMLTNEETGTEVAVAPRSDGTAALTVRQRISRPDRFYPHLKPVDVNLERGSGKALPKRTAGDDHTGGSDG